MSARLHPWAIIFRGLVAKLLDRQVGHFKTLVKDAEAQVVGRLADNCEIQTPFAEDGLGLLFLFGTQDHEHALLAFRKHHFIGRHALFTDRHMIKVQFDAEIALGAHFNRRTG